MKESMREQAKLCAVCLKYVLDELSEMEKKRFERHLRKCAACRAECREYEQYRDWLREDAALAGGAEESHASGAPSGEMTKRADVVSISGYSNNKTERSVISTKSSTKPTVGRKKWVLSPARFRQVVAMLAAAAAVLAALPHGEGREMVERVASSAHLVSEQVEQSVRAHLSHFNSLTLPQVSPLEGNAHGAVIAPTSSMDA
ncbi:MAG: zf-HC2 domain-containing protein [Alicyclobacillaceae bacterium]|nr:zf-HC2 domain-containing protein [Alicyclobacillaceae bacterium]